MNIGDPVTYPDDVRAAMRLPTVRSRVRASGWLSRLASELEVRLAPVTPVLVKPLAAFIAVKVAEELLDPDVASVLRREPPSLSEDVGALAERIVRENGILLRLDNPHDTVPFNLNSPRTDFVRLLDAIDKSTVLPPPGTVVASGPMPDGHWRLVEMDKSISRELGLWAGHCGGARGCGYRLHYAASYSDDGRRPVHLVTMLSALDTVLQIKGTKNSVPSRNSHPAILAYLELLQITRKAISYKHEADFNVVDLSEADAVLLRSRAPDLFAKWPPRERRPVRLSVWENDGAEFEPIADLAQVAKAEADDEILMGFRYSENPCSMRSTSDGNVHDR